MVKEIKIAKLLGRIDFPSEYPDEIMRSDDPAEALAQSMELEAVKIMETALAVKIAQEKGIEVLYTIDNDDAVDVDDADTIDVPHENTVMYIDDADQVVTANTDDVVLTDADSIANAADIDDDGDITADEIAAVADAIKEHVAMSTDELKRLLTEHYTALKDTGYFDAFDKDFNPGQAINGFEKRVERLAKGILENRMPTLEDAPDNSVLSRVSRGTKTSSLRK